jgi:hypothetical protein
MSANKSNLEVAMTITGIQTVEAGVQRVANAIQRGFKDAIVPVAGVAAALLGLEQASESVKAVLDMGRAFQTMKAVSGASAPLPPFRLHRIGPC